MGKSNQVYNAKPGEEGPSGLDQKMAKFAKVATPDVKKSVSAIDKALKAAEKAEQERKRKERERLEAQTQGRCLC